MPPAAASRNNRPTWEENDPLYKNRKTLLTRKSLLTDTQNTRLDELFTFDDDYAPLKTT
jgi:transposase